LSAGAPPLVLLCLFSSATWRGRGCVHPCSLPTAHTPPPCPYTADSVASHIAAKGGLQAVVAAMKSSAGKPEVQQYGAWALANVCWSDPDIRQRAVAAGACPVPVTAPLCGRAGGPEVPLPARHAHVCAWCVKSVASPASVLLGPGAALCFLGWRGARGSLLDAHEAVPAKHR
jgi:hypothetical protein